MIGQEFRQIFLIGPIGGSSDCSGRSPGNALATSAGDQGAKNAGFHSGAPPVRSRTSTPCVAIAAQQQFHRLPAHFPRCAEWAATARRAGLIAAVAQGWPARFRRDHAMDGGKSSFHEQGKSGHACRFSRNKGIRRFSLDQATNSYRRRRCHGQRPIWARQAIGQGDERFENAEFQRGARVHAANARMCRPVRAAAAADDPGAMSRHSRACSANAATVPIPCQHRRALS